MYPPFPISSRAAWRASWHGSTKEGCPGRSSQQNRPFKKTLSRGLGSSGPKCGSFLSRLEGTRGVYGAADGLCPSIYACPCLGIGKL